MLTRGLLSTRRADTWPALSRRSPSVAFPWGLPKGPDRAHGCVGRELYWAGPAQWPSTALNKWNISISVSLSLCLCQTSTAIQWYRAHQEQSRVIMLPTTCPAWYRTRRSANLQGGLQEKRLQRRQEPTAVRLGANTISTARKARRRGRRVRGLCGGWWMRGSEWPLQASPPSGRQPTVARTRLEHLFTRTACHTGIGKLSVPPGTDRGVVIRAETAR